MRWEQSIQADAGALGRTDDATPDDGLVGCRGVVRGCAIETVVALVAIVGCYTLLRVLGAL